MRTRYEDSSRIKRWKEQEGTYLREGTDRAWIEINMSNMHHNVRLLQEILPVGCEMMAVVKANAYGHGDVLVSSYLNRIGIRSFAVATLDEGICLRREGIEGDILILGYTSPARASELSYYNLSQAVVDAEHARELNSYGAGIKVHIKVDTGMNRLGESCGHVAEIASIYRCKYLKVSGIFTHLCVSDRMEEADIIFTNQQIQSFYELLDELNKRKVIIPKTHIQSSYGVLNYPELQCDYARVGIALYGVLSTPDATKSSLKLCPVLSLKSRIVLIKTINAGEGVGYGRSFTAKKDMKIAAVSIGYADGVPRSISGKGYVLIKGWRAPIIGRICMDQLTVDISGIPDTKTGDMVTLIGKDGSEEITAEQVSVCAGTITNELLSRLSSCRLKRIVSINLIGIV